MMLLAGKKKLSYFGWLEKSHNKPGLKSILALFEQLSYVDKICSGLPQFKQIPRKRILSYSDSLSRFNPSDIKTMPENSRYAHLTLYILVKRQSIIDHIVDMFSCLSKSIVHKSERKVVKKLVNEIKRVTGKENILCKLAEACIAKPNGRIKDTIFPVISEKKLANIIEDIKRKGPRYQNILQEKIKNSYSHYYRKMTQPMLEGLVFRCTNPSQEPLLKGLELIKQHFDSGTKYFPKDIAVPIDFIPSKWQARIIDSKNQRIQRTAYEVYVLKRLGDLLQCREIWVESAFKYRNPDADIPERFNTEKPLPYNELNVPQDADEFVASVKEKMSNALAAFNQQVPKNKKVVLTDKNGGRIVLTPLNAQEESQKLKKIKAKLVDKWSSTSLLDALKEVEIQLSFTRKFESQGEKIYLKPRELSVRLLLVIYGLGTNAGIKHMCTGNESVNPKKLNHVKQYFLTEANLRNTIGDIANELFKIRMPQLWGETLITVASDSTQFSAYFQNLIAEYHNRYGGRGIMIYWHVEKNAICVSSQLKSVSSSEVSSMITGVLKHCTSMSIKKNYVDTHGQSEVGFAFSHLLGFQLMPRFANINKQKLYQCEPGDYQEYKNLQYILTDTIKWDLIRAEYPQMVKYAAAMKEGYADPESLLKRFSRNNSTHPIYQALAQLGKAIKTIFLCNYLMEERIRQEVQEGLNVVELWNGVSKFIFYGRTGEIASNNPKNQELSVLCLHLLQLSMVYVNTLMLQEVILENGWLRKLTPEDKRAITPLIYAHINPYGLFPLDLDTRIDLQNFREAA